MLPSFPRRNPTRQRNRSRRLVCESLEERVLLAIDIQWQNRGATSESPFLIPAYNGLDLEPDDSDTPDNFNWVFCAQEQSCTQADQARNVVDAALESWEDVITDFNDGNNTDNVYTVTIAMDFFVNACGAGSRTPGPGDPANGIPDEGTFIINSCRDNMGNVQWFVDPTPNESSEFLDLIANAFTGFAPPGSPQSNQNDLFSLAAHEFGIHLLGITDDVDFLWQDLVDVSDPAINNTGQVDAAVGSGNPILGFLWTYDDGGVETLFTSNNGCTNGNDSGFPTHIAMPATGNQIAIGGTTFFGARDIGNPCLVNGVRTLPSLLLTRTLAEVYGYSTISHNAFPTFYAHLDSAGNLLIRGGSPGEGFFTPTGQSNDTFFLEQDGNNLRVELDIGIDVPGTGVNTQFVRSFPLSSINSITILGHDGTLSPGPDGDDIITLSFANGNWIPVGGIAIDGGSGLDTLNLIGQSDYVITSNTITLGGSGPIGYSRIGQVTVAMDLNAPQNSIVVASTSPNLDKLLLIGGVGQDTFIVEELDNATSLTISGSGGNDMVLLNPNGLSLDPVNGSVQVFGDGGFDQIFFHDNNDSSFNRYYFAVSLAGEGIVTRDDAAFPKKEFFYDVEQATLFAGPLVDFVEVQETPTGSGLDIFAGDGDDWIWVDHNGTAQPNSIVNPIHSHIFVDGGIGSNTLVVDDAGDNLPNTVTITDRWILGDGTFFGAGGSLEYAGMSALQVIMGNGGNTVVVASTAKGTDTTVNTGNGVDTISVVGPPDPDDPGNQPEDYGVADGVNSLLTINGQAEVDQLFVYDNADTTGDTATLTASTLGAGANDTLFGLPGDGGAMSYLSVEELRLFMGQGGDNLYVESTHNDTVDVFLKMGKGHDVTVVANASATLNDILSKVELDGEDGHDRLTLDDSGETLSTKVTLTPSQVGNEPNDDITGGGAFLYNGWEELLLETGMDFDRVLIYGTAQSTKTTVRTGPGYDLIDVDSNGTAAAGGLADFVMSPLIVDAGGDGNLTLNDESELLLTELTLTDAQILANGFFGPSGQVSYENLSNLTIRAGGGLNRFNVQSTAAASPVILIGGAGTDQFEFDSNGVAAPGGHVVDIRSTVQVFGGLGNNGVIVQNQDGAGAVVSMIPSTAQQGSIGAAAGDSFFGGGSVVYDAIQFVGTVTSLHADTINVAPSPSSAGTVFSINANGPSFSDPPPGDVLNLELTGVGNSKLELLDIGSAELSAATHAPILFANVELVTESSGSPFDLIVDMNTPALGGNDSIADVTEAFSGWFMTDKTFHLGINALPAFTTYESAVNSLVVSGSADDDDFIMIETVYGLPTFPGTAPNSHTNPEFAASGLTPQHVGIQFDGGPGAGIDRYELKLTTPQKVSEYQDTFQQPNVDPNSGVVNVDGVFTLSYESLSPIEVQGAGGTLTVDATLLTRMTDLRLTDLGDGRARISGDGGFEETTFGGFDELIIAAPNQIQLQTSFWVNTTGDAADVNPGDGLCQIAVGSNLCTLRAAIEESNAVPGPGNIYFRIPGTGPHTIQPTSALPTVTDPVFIDGLSQLGSVPNSLPIELGTNTQIMVEVNGGLITDGSSGLVITAGSSRVRGLAITGFGYPDMGAPGSPEDVPAGGIVLLGLGYNVIEGNFVGVDPATGSAEPNNFYGIFVSSSNNQIGGPHPSSRNLISGNQGFGIQLTGRQLPASPQFTPTEFNRIQGNLIGTDRTGNFALPNTGAGIVLRLHARHNLIGGDHTGVNPVRNIIAGNGGPFVPFGDPNGPYQDWPDAPYPLDGGHGAGIHIANLTTFTQQILVPNLIQGNYIGTSAQGTGAIPNLQGGISTGFTNSVTIGGASGAISNGLCTGVCNLISGNAQWGVGIANFVNTPSNAVVQGNFIGSDRTGTQPIGNDDDGVLMFLAEGNLIGGDVPDKGNLIAFNGRTGIGLRGHPAWINPSRNTIRLNSIHTNAALGIDLVADQTFGDGPTLNDPYDVDDGPNRLQNFPVLTSAQFGPATFVAGKLNSLAFSNFVLDFYASTLPDPSGFGEGQRYLGSTTVQTNASGDVSFGLLLPGGTQPGEFITATATAPSGDTSEFSPAINANIFLDNSVLRVLGTDKNDVIAVTREDDQYVVSADYLPPELPSLSFDATTVAEITIVTGDGADVIHMLAKLAEFKLTMDVVMGGGDDEFIAEFKPAEFKPAEFKPAEFKPAEFKPAEFKPAEFRTAVNMGQGDNVFDLLVSDVTFDVFELDALAGDGADQFDLSYQNVAVTESLTQSISAGDGADRINLVWQNVSINSLAETNLKGDAGADVMEVVARGGYVAAGGLFRLNMDGKHGNDKLRAQIVDLLLDGKLDLDLSGGHDNDTLAAMVQVAGRSRGTFSGVLDGDDGDDDLLFDLLAQNSLKIKKALADGGKGLDRCRASRNVTVVNCER